MGADRLRDLVAKELHRLGATIEDLGPQEAHIVHGLSRMLAAALTPAPTISDHAKAQTEFRVAAAVLHAYAQLAEETAVEVGSRATPPAGTAH